MDENLIKSSFDLHVRTLATEMERLPWQERNFYAGWLAQTYYFVINSTRLIALAGSMFSQEQDAFHRRFIEHAKEEFNHERLAIADLKRLGFKIDQLPELPVTAGFWQSQMYWILSKGPESFYGYILCLEGLAVLVGRELHERVVKFHGKKAGSFLQVHANEDVAHLDQAFDLVGRVVQDKHSSIAANMKQCCGLYARMLHELKSASFSHERPQSKPPVILPRAS